MAPCVCARQETYQCPDRFDSTGGELCTYPKGEHQYALMSKAKTLKVNKRLIQIYITLWENIFVSFVYASLQAHILSSK